MPDSGLGFGPEDLDDQHWLVCIHDVSGCPAVLRVLAELPPDLAAEELPDRVAIIWRYEPEQDGLPSEQECERMDFVEDLIGEVVETRLQACLAIVAMVNGLKEWTIYARDGAEVAAYLARLAHDNDLPISVRRDTDPDWDVYHRMLAATEDD